MRWTRPNPSTRRSRRESRYVNPHGARAGNRPGVSRFVATDLPALTTIGLLIIAGVLPAGDAVAQENPRSGSLARITSFQNQVETSSAADDWQRSVLNQPLYERYRVRTGALSRAGILYKDETLHRLSEKSEMEILSPTEEKPGLLKLLLGRHYFASRAPKEFKSMETPVVTAAIRGTEFVVEIDADSTTRITMLEGVLDASNLHGSITVESGEQAFVEPGKAPVKRIVVRPRDAVAWALYYPPVLAGRDAERARGLGADGNDLIRAAELLSAGQVEQATPLIEAVRGRRPGDPIVLALMSVIEVTRGDRDEALRLAEEAFAADPASSAAALAVSFAAQAKFDIQRAREMAEKAAAADPENALALARAAELRMAEGDLEGAEAAARRAVERAPNQARALAVLGFVKLAQLQSTESEVLFEQAVAADPGLSLARLGLGIARIRAGQVRTGREELQTAVGLDPDDSLLRSYLAKAYYEAKRSGAAAKELAAAKQLDPNDPTPYLYDAILKQNENRPVEALSDLRESIVRNDNRAVYRSRLLLDEDKAVRGSDLARIYNDLGFEQLGLVAARRSADQDQSNYSSHLFLAGNYRSVPDFSPALLSEVLQARIYQPVSVNAARPDVVNESVSFNEYTALFDRPRARVFGSLTYGETTTSLDAVSTADLLEESGIHGGDLTATMNGDRFALAVGYSRGSNDGFRLNNDAKLAKYRGFYQIAPTYRDSFQVNILVGRDETGDSPIRFDPQKVALSSLAPERIDSNIWNVGFGYHHSFSPGSDFIVSVIDNRTRQMATVPTSFVTTAEAESILDGPQLEVQQVFRKRKATWILGAGAFRGDITLKSGASTLSVDDRFSNAYGYLNLRPSERFELTVGVSGESVDAPSGLLTPRDFLIAPTEIGFSESKLSPKLGFSYFPTSKTVLRAAAFYRLSPAIGRIQTLEPTQVAGFNQFFFEPGGTRSRSYGIGVDQEFTSRLFGGLSVLRRDLEIPEAFCDDPDPAIALDPLFFSAFGCLSSATGPTPVTRVLEKESKDWIGSAYINAILSKRLSLAIDFSYHDREFDFIRRNNNDPGFFGTSFEDALQTTRIRSQLRWFLPNGLFASATGTYFDQQVNQRNGFMPPAPAFLPGVPEREEIKVDFWLLDLTVGYKLPKRYGTILLQGRNVTNREFEFFERALEEIIVPAREVTLTVSFTL